MELPGLLRSPMSTAEAGLHRMFESVHTISESLIRELEIVELLLHLGAY